MHVLVFFKSWINCHDGIRISIGESFIGVGIATGEPWVTIGVFINRGVKVSIVISVLRSTSNYSRTWSSKGISTSNSNTVRIRVGLRIAKYKRLLKYMDLFFRV